MSDLMIEDDNETMTPPEGFVDTKTQKVAEETAPMQEVTPAPVVEAHDVVIPPVKSPVVEEVQEPAVQEETTEDKTDAVVEEEAPSEESKPQIISADAPARDEKLNELKERFREGSSDVPTAINPERKLVSTPWGHTDRIPHRIWSRELAKLLAGARKAQGDVSKLEIYDVIEFDSDKTRHGETALWDEGGADEKEGTALIIAGANGEKLPAITAYNNTKDGNGKHALLKVMVGQYIVMGAQVTTANGKSDVVILCRISRIERNLEKDVVRNGIKASVTYDKVVSNLVKVWCDGEELEIGGKGSDTDPALDSAAKLFTYEHPAVKACVKRMYEEYAYTPAYIADYVSHRFCYDDYRDMLTDSEFINRGQRYDTLKELYQAVHKVTGDATQNLEATRHVIVETVLDTAVSKVDGNTRLLVYVAGLIYDTKTKTSRNGGRIFYGFSVLGEGDSYFDLENLDIIDTSPDAANLKRDYSFVVKYISGMGNNRPKSCVRRMTVN